MLGVAAHRSPTVPAAAAANRKVEARHDRLEVGEPASEVRGSGEVAQVEHAAVFLEDDELELDRRGAVEGGHHRAAQPLALDDADVALLLNLPVAGVDP